MCGITGIYNPIKPDQPRMKAVLAKMTAALKHRGPDDYGMWIDETRGIALGHRRLSIIDLSEYGKQPMISHSGRYIIVFNGEIYNFREIGLELEKHDYSFRGHSDTEVMLAAIEEYGIAEAIRHFIGMFAFALWDKHDEALYLVRDRLGIKPLYYGWSRDTFLFGSELKAICANLESTPEIDINSLALYLRYNNIPQPYSIYKNIYKLPQGTILKIDRNRVAKDVTPVPYWSARKAVEDGTRSPFTGSEDEAMVWLENLLKDAVRLRMISDVPLGAFMSGGIDSSLVIALMQNQSSKPINTFTIGFNETGFNEAGNAKLVANSLGTNHTELYVTPEDTLKVIPELPFLYDEPFADSSQIPTYLISKLTKQFVKVALSGDGGDEIFAGYNRYLWFKNKWGRVSFIPSKIRNAAADILLSFTARKTLSLFFHGNTALLIKLQKAGEVLKLSSPEDIYMWLVSHCKEPSKVIPNAIEPEVTITDSLWADNLGFIEKMMYFDLVMYLPDDILVKLDRASMAVSLEARVPLLDHRVVELAWRLPLSLKIRNQQGKWILKQILYKYVPKKLVDRPKMGFAVPVDIWLRGPLRDWAESLLDSTSLKNGGFFDAGVIRDKWQEHLNGTYNWKDFLWPILMFQAWRRYWL